ncbi:hypothetical protein SH2C18_29920 [Clostridium sediminicola]|uniref:sensor histidine kinase n=1 Tax=Clostridium sediminicola TaxID=3114879 RepID=UPI0031F2783F
MKNNENYHINLNIKKSKLFFKNVILFLIPVLLPVIVLGGISIGITKQYVQQNIKKNNMNMLEQARGNVALIFNEIDSLYINFSTNPEIIIKLKNILRKSTLNREEYKLLESIRNFIDAPANARNYIHSIYVFFENDHGRVLTTTEGLISNDAYYDMEWKTQFNEMGMQKNTWLQSRIIKSYSFDKFGKRVVTIYRTINAYTGNRKQGVIVLNIDAKYIDNFLNKLDILPEQSIIITDENNEIIFKNKDLPYLHELKIEEFIKSDKEYIRHKIGNKTYIISKLKWDQYGCNFLSIVPEKNLYRIPFILTDFVVVILIVLIIIGITLTYYLMKKNISHLIKIIKVLDCAERGENISEYIEDAKDEYGYITNKIVESNILQRYFKVQLSERKYKQKTLEFLALNSQINPHFLYNTLETIYWKSFQFTGKPNSVTDMIENLSDILKYSLHTKDDEVTIRDEIKNTKSYLRLQKVRYRDKFDVVWEYEEQILNYKMIRLVLQPLIENSIYHGIKEKEGKSEIKIRIFQQGDFIKFSVVDTGAGMNEERLLEIREKLESDDVPHNHIGLLNTSKRLFLMYGLEAKLDITSKHGEGTTVTFNIPMQRQTTEYDNK